MLYAHKNAGSSFTNYKIRLQMLCKLKQMTGSKIIKKQYQSNLSLKAIEMNKVVLNFTKKFNHTMILSQKQEQLKNYRL